MRRFIFFLVPMLFASCTSAIGASPVVHRVVATPVPTGHASVTVSLPKPKAAPAVVKSVARPVPAPRVVPPKPVALTADIISFRRLGSWIDMYDYKNDPATIRPLVAGVARAGNKTLYLETSRYTDKGDIAFPVALGAALDDAKALGLRVVAWYPPDFGDTNRDIRRSLAAVRFRSPKGNRFDAFAADIEYTAGVKDANERSKRTVQYSRALRAAVGLTYPLGAIVIPPTSLQMNKNRWPGFPWAAIGPSYDVFMPMNYWTAHGRDAATAARLTKANAQQTRSLTGKPVHVIGGLGEQADTAQVKAYVDAARAGGSIGGGLYDFRTTKADVWGELRRFNV